MSVASAIMSNMTETIPEATNPYTAPPAKKTNVLALVAMIVAVVGFIFACIPGALIVGWVLLPIAFILSIVSLFLKGDKKWFGIVGLILSIVGTIVGIVVFLSVVATAFDDAFSGTETTITQPTDTDEEPSEAAAGPDGTRGNPYPLGTVLENDDWTVVVNSVNLDAANLTTAENMFNDAPADGNVHILVNVTLTYTGTDEGMGAEVGIEYVTPGGVTVNTYDTLVIAPDALDSITTIYEGATITGNVAFEVPADGAADGVLAITPGLFADKTFIAVQ